MCSWRVQWSFSEPETNRLSVTVRTMHDLIKWVPVFCFSSRRKVLMLRNIWRPQAFSSCGYCFQCYTFRLWSAQWSELREYCCEAQVRYLWFLLWWRLRRWARMQIDWKAREKADGICTTGTLRDVSKLFRAVVLHAEHKSIRQDYEIFCCWSGSPTDAERTGNN